MSPRTTFIAAISLFLAFSNVRAESDIPTLETRLEKLSAQVVSEQSEMDQISKQLDRSTAQIQVIRKRHSSLIKNYRLESAMKAAKEVSDRLDLLTRQKGDTDRSIRETQIELSSAYDLQIRKRLQTLLRSGISREERKSHAQEVDRLSLKRAKLLLSLKEKPFPSVAASGLADSPQALEDVQERLNAIYDFEKRLNVEAASLKLALADARRQRFVNNEVAHLLDEESFFGEQGYIRSTARTSTDSTNSLARTGTSTDASKGPVAAASPVNPAPSSAASPMSGSGKDPSPQVSVAAGPTNPVASPLAAGDVSSESTVAPQSKLGVSLLETNSVESLPKTERDPLLKLADEFGIPLKERSLEPTTNRTEWLERRLSTTENILARLAEIARSLEHRLNK